jgi:hypothetical protein
VETLYFEAFSLSQTKIFQESFLSFLSEEYKSLKVDDPDKLDSKLFFKQMISSLRQKFAKSFQMLNYKQPLKNINFIILLSTQFFLAKKL